ncbi:MAG: Cro/Cl family transcriptional regulator [Holophagae bacterium]|nr:MAG: Cro/Cl family transcriptional regulator [Holophagae bacterium]
MLVSDRPVALKAALRHEAIRREIEVKGRVSIAELKDRLDVSEVTIRGDLEHLEWRGVLTRIRGGAVASRDRTLEMSLEETSTTNRAEKMAIGARAASMVKDGQTVIIDVGSTTTEMAKALSPHLSRVVVITNGLNIALILEALRGISVIVTGGTLRPLQHSLVAPMGTLLLDQLNADVAFLGCNGVHPARGFTNTNIAEAEIKQAMVRSAEKVVVLADHDKLGKVASAFVGDISGADLLITDDGADETLLRNLRSEGLAIDVVRTGSGQGHVAMDQRDDRGVSDAGGG